MRDGGNLQQQQQQQQFQQVRGGMPQQSSRDYAAAGSMMGNGGNNGGGRGGGYNGSGGMNSNDQYQFQLQQQQRGSDRDRERYDDFEGGGADYDGRRGGGGSSSSQRGVVADPLSVLNKLNSIVAVTGGGLSAAQMQRAQLNPTGTSIVRGGRGGGASGGFGGGLQQPLRNFHNSSVQGLQPQLVSSLGGAGYSSQQQQLPPAKRAGSVEVLPGDVRYRGPAAASSSTGGNTMQQIPQRSGGGIQQVGSGGAGGFVSNKAQQQAWQQQQGMRSDNGALGKSLTMLLSAMLCVGRPLCGVWRCRRLLSTMLQCATVIDVWSPSLATTAAYTACYCKIYTTPVPRCCIIRNNNRNNAYSSTDPCGAKQFQLSLSHITRAILSGGQMICFSLRHIRNIYTETGVCHLSASQQPQ